MTLHVAALGDSTSCGEGIGLRIPLERTWPALLTAAIPGGELLPLAAPGAQVREVLSSQVPRAIDGAPALITLLIGLNDVWRSGFRPASYAADLHAVLRLLMPTGATVLLGRLHDPCQQLPVPGRLRRSVRERIAAINDVVDEAAEAPHVLMLDLGTIAGLRLRSAWDLDRLHPGSAGHAFIAQRAAHVLRSDGLPVGQIRPVAVPPPPGRVQEGRWLARAGLPWLAAHLPELVRP